MPATTTCTVEADPPQAGRGVFDVSLFDGLLFDNGDVSFEDDPPLVPVTAEADPVLAQCHDGDYESEDYTDEFFIDWCAVTVEADPGRTPITVEADPHTIGRGMFDLSIFDGVQFDTLSLTIDEDTLPVAIMVEA